jgi:hypothetical protein
VRARGTGVALALFAASTCLIAGRAWAQGTMIVHVVPPQPIFYSDVSPDQSIDINNDGVTDFILSGGQDINLSPLNNNAIISLPELPPDWGALIYALAQGAPISSSLDPFFVWWGASGGAATIVSASNIGSIGYFQGNTDAFAGIRLDVTGSLYYGWLHIHNLTANWGQISDWAYETRPDTQILAGAVPEPSTLSLLLVFGAAFWLVRKRL